MTDSAAVSALRLAAAMALLAPSLAAAQDEVLTFEGEVPEEGDFFEVPFEVPEGIAELEVRHDDGSEDNILDWGLLGPDGFRGYGGGNPEPAIVGAEAASRSYLPGPIQAGTWRVYVGKAKIVERPARYDIEVVLRESPTLEPQPERAEYTPAGALSDEARWYAGDFHVHSRQSGDAVPTMEEVAEFARMRGLDFVMLSEHNTVAQLDRYAAVQEAYPDLLLVPGIEITTYRGHANAIGATEWVDHRLGADGRTMDDVVDDVRAQDALFSPTHPAFDLGDACIGCKWEADVEAGRFDAVEIQTGDIDITGLFHRRSIRFWDSRVAEGHHIAAVGGSDDHRGGMGTGAFDSPIGSPTTMVWAEELSAEQIIQGVRDGRTVVKLKGPDDPMVTLDAEGRKGDTVIADRPALRVRVTGVGAAGGNVHLVHNGMRGEPVVVVDDPFELEQTVAAPPSGQDAYRAELHIGGQARVVTSHVFVQRATPGGGADAGTDSGTRDAGPKDAGAADAEGSGGGGCAVQRTGPGDAPMAWLAVLVLVALIRRGVGSSKALRVTPVAVLGLRGEAPCPGAVAPGASRGASACSPSAPRT